MPTQSTKRNTEQKKAIEKVFQNTDRPLSPEEVLTKGREFAPSLNQATVYRNLKILVNDNWLSKIYLPEAGNLYERSNKGHHHHFHCRVCKKSYDIKDCVINNTSNLSSQGFHVENHEIFYYGVCPNCSNP